MVTKMAFITPDHVVDIQVGLVTSNAVLWMSPWNAGYHLIK